MATSKTMDSAMPGLEDAIAAAQEETTPTEGLEIPVPNGFEAPEDAQSGSSFDVLATVKMQDGKLTLEAIDGLPVLAQADAEDEEDMDDDGEMPGDADGEGFVGAIERSMAEAEA